MELLNFLPHNFAQRPSAEILRLEREVQLYCRDGLAFRIMKRLEVLMSEGLIHGDALIGIELEHCLMEKDDEHAIQRRGIQGVQTASD